jgi:histidinol-phosphate/aromatic aminotransferase/cobyric acid decarboxylase-like protein
LVRPATRVLIVEPTFAEFRAASQCAGGRIVEWRAQAERAFAIDLSAVVAAARACEAAVLYLCAPNTPAGTGLAAASIAAAARELPGTTWVLDQSFLSLSERWADVSQVYPDNVVCVRSLTKEQGIPGVRIGYLLATPALCERIEAERPAWTTGAHAQAAAIAACATGAFVARSRAALLGARVELSERLHALGLHCAPSTTGFVLVRTGAAAGLRARLLSRHRIAIRDCGSFGLPEYVRLGARPAADRDRLLRALEQEL